MSFTYLIYTHEEYSDVLYIHLKRLTKHYPGIKPKIATNSIEYLIKNYSYISENDIIIYDSKQTYAEKVKSVLQTIKTKYVLFNHDNNILVGDVNVEKINEILLSMENNNIDQFRLFVSGIDNADFSENLLKENKGPYYYSVISALWNVNTLVDIMSVFNNSSYRTIELHSQEYVSKFNNYYLSSPNDKQFTNEGHYLSYYFPICHCITYGKWITIGSPMNKKFIEDISIEYNIDLNKRGHYNK
uniref:Uncharacterized protein n=1 Tax=viral metagenome TaxID=1070528 RepID=A0A6C0KM54_9ZZZZ